MEDDKDSSSSSNHSRSSSDTFGRHPQIGEPGWSEHQDSLVQVLTEQNEREARERQQQQPRTWAQVAQGQQQDPPQQPAETDQDQAEHASSPTQLDERARRGIRVLRTVNSPPPIIRPTPTHIRQDGHRSPDEVSDEEVAITEDSRPPSRLQHMAHQYQNGVAPNLLVTLRIPRGFRPRSPEHNPLSTHLPLNTQLDGTVPVPASSVGSPDSQPNASNGNGHDRRTYPVDFTDAYRVPSANYAEETRQQTQTDDNVQASQLSPTDGGPWLNNEASPRSSPSPPLRSSPSLPTLALENIMRNMPPNMRVLDASLNHDEEVPAPPPSGQDTDTERTRLTPHGTHLPTVPVPATDLAAALRDSTADSLQPSPQYPLSDQSSRRPSPAFPQLNDLANGPARPQRTATDFNSWIPEGIAGPSTMGTGARTSSPSPLESARLQTAIVDLMAEGVAGPSNMGTGARTSSRSPVGNGHQRREESESGSDHGMIPHLTRDRRDSEGVRWDFVEHETEGQTEELSMEETMPGLLHRSRVVSFEELRNDPEHGHDCIDAEHVQADWQAMLGWIQAINGQAPSPSAAPAGFTPDPSATYVPQDFAAETDSDYVAREARRGLDMTGRLSTPSQAPSSPSPSPAAPPGASYAAVAARAIRRRRVLELPPSLPSSERASSPGATSTSESEGLVMPLTPAARRRQEQQRAEQQAQTGPASSPGVTSTSESEGLVLRLTPATRRRQQQQRAEQQAQTGPNQQRSAGKRPVNDHRGRRPERSWRPGPPSESSESRAPPSRAERIRASRNQRSIVLAERRREARDQQALALLRHYAARLGDDLAARLLYEYDNTPSSRLEGTGNVANPSRPANSGAPVRHASPVGFAPRALRVVEEERQRRGVAVLSAVRSDGPTRLPDQRPRSRSRRLEPTTAEAAIDETTRALNLGEPTRTRRALSLDSVVSTRNWALNPNLQAVVNLPPPVHRASSQDEPSPGVSSPSEPPYEEPWRQAVARHFGRADVEESPGGTRTVDEPPQLSPMPMVPVIEPPNDLLRQRYRARLQANRNASEEAATLPGPVQEYRPFVPQTQTIASAASHWPGAHWPLPHFQATYPMQFQPPMTHPAESQPMHDHHEDDVVMVRARVQAYIDEGRAQHPGFLTATDEHLWELAGRILKDQRRQQGQNITIVQSYPAAGRNIPIRPTQQEIDERIRRTDVRLYLEFTEQQLAPHLRHLSLPGTSQAQQQTGVMSPPRSESTPPSRYDITPLSTPSTSSEPQVADDAPETAVENLRRRSSVPNTDERGHAGLPPQPLPQGLIIERSGNRLDSIAAGGDVLSDTSKDGENVNAGNPLTTEGRAEVPAE
ncbi:hypothetical protein LTR37_006402 [Vermiconidia calcicola]|uniref:Uncharacterized protein n=1 Tax=Vermiconidia calcicola TaxID=1690605 RepID=A0ACC3NGB7_9PEZI|nr:hypothetical protein LTR37_006402 [Vermiconidia calcicola]